MLEVGINLIPPYILGWVGQVIFKEYSFFLSFQLISI